MRRACLLAAVVIGLTTGCGSSADPGSAPSATALRNAEAEIVALLVDSRTAAGLPGLVRDPALDSVARAWARQLAASGQLEHNPAYADQIPDGWTESGENVGWLDAATQTIDGLPAALHEAWLDSPTHRANIEDPAFTAVGVGIAYDAAHGYYVAQNFAAYPGSASATPT